ncbi:MAG: CHAT domain-containing protein, partial [Calditrichaeota bacterium]
LYREDRNREALAMGEEILALSQQLGYRQQEAWEHYNLGLIYSDLGDHRTALEQFEQAVEISGELQDSTCTLYSLGRMAISFDFLGKREEALNIYTRIIQSLGAFNRKTLIIKSYVERGLVYKKVGEYSFARKDLETALTLLEQDSSDMKAVVLVNLGEVYRQIGMPSKALSYLRQAEHIFARLGIPHDRAAAIKIMGDVFRDTHRYDQALDRYKAALKILRDAQAEGRHRGEQLQHEIDLSMGDVYRVQGNLSRALTCYGQALSGFRRSNFPDGTVHALIRIANVLREKWNFPAALDTLKKALVETGKLQKPNPRLSSNIYFTRGLVQRDQRHFNLAEKALARAIQTVEQTRLMNQEEERIGYFATTQDIYDEMILLQYEQGNFAAAFDYAERSRARTLQEALRTEERITSLTLKEVQDSLPEAVHLLAYKVTHRRLLIFGLSNTEFVHTTLPLTRETLKAEVTAFRRAIGAADEEAYGDFASGLKENPQRVYQRSLQSAHRLYQYLVEPMEDFLTPGSVLYVIPDDVLYYVPFAALVRNPEGEAEFLIDRFPIAYAPGAAVLLHCLSRSKDIPDNAPLRLFAVGNPTGDLEFSEQEVRGIAPLFGEVDTLMGIQASEDSILHLLQGRSYEVYHFATHAIINEQDPALSFLAAGIGARSASRSVLRTGASTSTYPGDDLLTAREIGRLHFRRPQLVVLSACRTAGGHLFRGEGLVGMTQAFLKTGTPTLIATLWDIDDEYTGKLITEFYRQWLQEGKPKVVALQAAQHQIMEALRRDPRLQYPQLHRWAAFVLTGAYR